MISLIALTINIAIANPLGASTGYQGNSLLAVHPTGFGLAVAATDSGMAGVIDTVTMKPRWEMAIGSRPEGITWIGTGTLLAATIYDEDFVVILDGSTGNLIHRIPVEDEPYGIISNNDGSRLYVSHDYPGKISEINPSTGKVVRILLAGARTRGIALNQSSNRLYVTEFLTANLNCIDLLSGKVIDSWKSQPSDNLARQVTLHPSRPKAYVPHIRSRTRIINGTGSIFPQLTIFDLVSAEREKRRKSIGMDTYNGVYVVTNPWEVAITQDGKHLFSLYSGTDDMNVSQVIDDDYKEIERLGGPIRVGRNPRAVRVSHDDCFVFVYDTSDFAIRKLDSRTLQTLGIAQLVIPKRSKEWIRGRILWNSADSPMSSRRWVACSSCHPDGQPDGRVWNNPEGLRKTTNLEGVAHTHPLHWSADRDEVQDFEYTIRSKLMMGPGLLRERIKPKDGFNKTELEEKTAGRSADLDALAIYTNSFDFKGLSPHTFGLGKLSLPAQRGQSLFIDPNVGCSSCHSGPYYSDSKLKKTNLHDVGTGRSDASERMGYRYDTPTLLGIYRTAPYLHDGSAFTLKDVLTTANSGDKHGKTSHLTPPQKDDLVAYLMSLPYEDPPTKTDNLVKFHDLRPHPKGSLK